MTKVTFHPQAWVNDYAVAVDNPVPCSWDAGEVPEDMEDDSFESDGLLYAGEKAPQWAQDWSGPFWVEIHREEKVS